MEFFRRRFRGHLSFGRCSLPSERGDEAACSCVHLRGRGLGQGVEVADALFKLAEVKEVHVIPGRHDIMAVVEVPRKLLEPDAQSIYWFIVERIKTIGDVTDTETLIPIVSASKWSD